MLCFLGKHVLKTGGVDTNPRGLWELRAKTLGPKQNGGPKKKGPMVPKMGPTWGPNKKGGPINSPVC